MSEASFSKLLVDRCQLPVKFNLKADLHENNNYIQRWIEASLFFEDRERE
jgi:hypothetical protein